MIYKTKTEPTEDHIPKEPIEDKEVITLLVLAFFTMVGMMSFISFFIWILLQL